MAKSKNDKQWSTKTTQKTKEWATRTPLETGGELRTGNKFLLH